jgi:Ca2+-binding EF-hand superfamily protein
LSLDQNKDGQINRKDMIRIIEAMYDLANEEDRNGEKSPDKRVDLIMQRLNKDKDGKKNIFSYYEIFILFLL